MLNKKKAEDWIDAYFMSIEIACQCAADPEKMRDLTKGTFKEIPKFNIEAYRERKVIWQRVRTELVAFGIDIEEVEFDGIEPVCEGSSQLKFNTGKPVVRLFHNQESSLPLEFKGHDALVVIGFLEFYLTAYQQAVDPTVYVKSVLSQQGVTAENFDEHKDKLLINNPWE